MPSLRIHEEVAYIFASKYKEYDNRDFYLGVMAPDSPNLEGFAPKVIRWEAHQRDKDLDIWENNIIKFYKENKDKYNKYFIFGYMFHVLTDIIFDRDFYDVIINKVDTYNDSNIDNHKILVEDMNNYGSNFKEFNHLKEMLLKEDKYYDILNINKELLKGWINLNLKNIDKKEYKYFSSDIVKQIEEIEENILIYNDLLK